MGCIFRKEDGCGEKGNMKIGEAEVFQNVILPPLPNYWRINDASLYQKCIFLDHTLKAESSDMQIGRSSMLSLIFCGQLSPVPAASLGQEGTPSPSFTRLGVGSTCSPNSWDESKPAIDGLLTEKKYDASFSHQNLHDSCFPSGLQEILILFSLAELIE